MVNRINSDLVVKILSDKLNDLKLSKKGYTVFGSPKNNWSCFQEGIKMVFTVVSIVDFYGK